MLEDKSAQQLYRTAALHELWARTKLSDNIHAAAGRHAILTGGAAMLYTLVLLRVRGIYVHGLFGLMCGKTMSRSRHTYLSNHIFKQTLLAIQYGMGYK